MSNKDEFVAAAAPLAIEDLQKWRDNINVKAFTTRLNENPKLRKAFRAAVAEAKAGPETSAEEQATAGLANLFSGV